MTRVVLHSVAFVYFPAETQERIEAMMAERAQRATPDAPLAWLAYEADAQDKFTLRLRLWPGGEERLLARCHPHGARIEWVASEPGGT